MLKVVADRSMDQLWVPFSRYRGPYAITMPCRCLWCIRGARPCWGTAELDQNEESPQRRTAIGLLPTSSAQGDQPR